MSEVILTDANFEAEVLKSKGAVLVDFYAVWCGPCKMLTPVIDELAAEYAGKAKICKLNVDDAPNIAASFRVSSIPALLFFKDGAVVHQSLGLQTKEELKKQLDSLL